MITTGILMIIGGLLVAGYLLGFFGAAISIPLTERAGFTVVGMGVCIAVIGLVILTIGLVK